MIKGILLYTVCAALDHGIYIPIRYIILKERLRTPFWLAMVMNMTAIFVEGVLLFHIDEMTHTSALVDFCRISFVCVYIVLSLITIADRWQKILFLVFIYVPVAFFGIGLTTLITDHVFVLTEPMDILMINDVVRLCYVVVSSYPAYSLIVKYLKPAGQMDSIGIWRSMWFIPLSFSIVDFLTVRYIFVQEVEMFQVLIRFTCLSGSLMACINVAEVLRREAEGSKEKEVFERAEQLLSMQKKQYEDLALYVEELRKIKHDARHHLRVIKSLAMGGNVEELVEYISASDENVKTPLVFDVSHNFAVNAIISYYADMAKEKGIEVELRVRIPEQIGIKDTDLSVVLGNCLENSIEAQEFVEGEKRISVRAKCFENKVYFVIENTFDGKVEKEMDSFLSRKLEFKYTGIGLTSVKEVVEKYHGELKIMVSKEKKTFTVMLMLEQQKPEEG